MLQLSSDEAGSTPGVLWVSSAEGESREREPLLSLLWSFQWSDNHKNEQDNFETKTQAFGASVLHVIFSYSDEIEMAD